MDKQYPVLFNQQNYSDLLGNSKTETIAMGGCFVTSFAMKANYYGVAVDPPSLNQLFAKIYVQGDLLSDNALSLVYPQIKYVKTLDYEPIPTDLNNIQALLADPATTLTIRINLGSGNFHFVEAVACDGHVLHIANPWSGKIEDFSQNYGDPVRANLHVIVYIGTPAVQPVTTDGQNGQSPLALRFSQAITKANNFNVIADYLGITEGQRVTTTAGQLVVDKFKELQDELIKAHEETQKLLESIPTTPTVTLPTPSVDTPAPSTKPVETPTFRNGSVALPSNPADTVSTATPTATQAQRQNLLQSIWKTLVFWLG